MATTRHPRGNPYSVQFWKSAGRPRYLLETIFLFCVIVILFLAYRYFVDSEEEAFDQKMCGKSLQELCSMNAKLIEFCKVTDACINVRQNKKDAEVAAKSEYPLVLVEVFYETLCPDSKDFIIDQLYPTLQKVGGITNFSLVPYGKAKQRKEKDEYVFTCQHGPKECKGNIIQTCAIHLLAKKESPLAISLIHCMEVSHDPTAAGPACAKDVGVDFKPIEACASGKMGNELQHVMADRTENTRPKLDWVPWIVINGLHTEELQQKSSSDLQSLVCSTYKGPKPPGCNE